MNTTEIFSPYAIIALAAKTELEKIEKKMSNPKYNHEKKILKRQFGDVKSLINRSFRLTGDFMPVHISEQAKKYCVSNKFGDISKIKWSSQAKFEKMLKREFCKLKHEHKTTVGSLVDSLRKVKNLNKAIKIFEKQEIVWVTKKEDEKLVKSKRPNSSKSYRDAKIVIIKNKNPVGYLFRT